MNINGMMVRSQLNAGFMRCTIIIMIIGIVEPNRLDLQSQYCFYVLWNVENDTRLISNKNDYRYRQEIYHEYKYDGLLTSWKHKKKINQSEIYPVQKKFCWI